MSDSPEVSLPLPVSTDQLLVPTDGETASSLSRPVVPRRISSSSRKSAGKSFRDSLLISLQQQKTSPAPSRRASGNVPGLSNLRISADGKEDNSKEEEAKSLRSSFPMIPSLRNSLRSSIHSNLKSKKNSITKDINSIMEIYDLISVKDFGYPASNSLHYGLSNYELYLNNQSSSQLDSYYNNYNQTDFNYYQDPGVSLSQEQEAEPTEVQRAIAMFDFQAENDNELELKEDQLINILYRHGGGWLVGEDPETLNTGLIPEEYVELIFEEDGSLYTASQVVDEDKSNVTTDGENEQDNDSNVKEEEDIFYNARSQLTSPIDLTHESNIHPTEGIESKMTDENFDARTTQITESPLNHNRSMTSLGNDTESNYTLNRESTNISLNEEEPQKEVSSNQVASTSDSEHHDSIGKSLSTSNYLKFLQNSSTTPNPIIDKTADSSGSDKYSNELESETSDLQIDNAELKPFLPEIFRVSSANSNTVNSSADSPLSLSNSISYPRFHKRSTSNNNNLFFNSSMRNSSGYSSGSNSLINGKSGLHASSSLNSNMNLSLTFGNGSPTTAVLTGTAVAGPHINRRGSVLFGSGLIQSKSTNSINLKMTTVSSMMSIPRSTSLTRSFGGSIGNDDLEEFSRFKPPNLLSKDNYFMNGLGGPGNISLNANTSVLISHDERMEKPLGETSRSNSNFDDDDRDFWVDEEFKDFEKQFQNQSNKGTPLSDERVIPDDFDKACITPVTSTPVTSTPNEVGHGVSSLLTSRLPKSLTMKSISNHTKQTSFNSNEGDKKRGFTRALSRKFSKIRLKNP